MGKYRSGEIFRGLQKVYGLKEVSDSYAVKEPCVYTVVAYQNKRKILLETDRVGK